MESLLATVLFDHHRINHRVLFMCVFDLTGPARALFICYC